MPRRLWSLALIVVLIAGPALMFSPAHAQDPSTITYQMRDGSLVVDYPADWFAETERREGIVVLSTSSAAVEAYSADQSPPASGAAQHLVISPTVMTVAFGVSTDQPATDLVTEILTLDLRFEQTPQPIVFAGRPMLEGWSSSNRRDEIYHFVDLGNDTSTMLLTYTAPGEREDHIVAARQIARTMRHPDVPLADLVTNAAAGGLGATQWAFENLPPGWGGDAYFDLAVVRSAPAEDVRVAMTVEPEASLEEVADRYQRQLARRDGAEVGEALPVNGAAVLRVDSRYATRDEVLIVQALEDGGVVILFASMPDGQRERFVRELLGLPSRLLATAGGPRPGLLLSETFTDTDSSLTLNYPGGWLVEADPFPNVATDAVVIGSGELIVSAFVGEADAADVPAGEIVMLVLGPAALADSFAPGASDPVAVINGILASNVTLVEGPEAFQLEGRASAYAILRTGGDYAALYIATTLPDGGLVLLIASTPGAPDGIRPFRPTLEQIALSVSVAE